MPASVLGDLKFPLPAEIIDDELGDEPAEIGAMGGLGVLHGIRVKLRGGKGDVYAVAHATHLYTRNTQSQQFTCVCSGCVLNDRMAKKAVHKKTVRVNVLLAEHLHSFGKERGREFNGFGPYIERLIVADMSRKNSIAYRFGRIARTSK